MQYGGWVHMASMLYSRVISCPFSLYRTFPKVSWLRSLSSDSSGNGSGKKISASSFLTGLRRPTSGEAELKNGEEEFEKAPANETEGNKEHAQLQSELCKVQASNEQEKTSYPEGLTKKFSSLAASLRQNLEISGAKPELGNVLKLLRKPKGKTKETAKEQKEPAEEVKRTVSTLIQQHLAKKSDAILQELRDDASDTKLPSGGSSSLLDSLKSVEESAQDDVKSLLEKSIDASRNRKRGKFGDSFMPSEAESLSQKPERKWVERNLEDLEKTLSKAELSQTKADPELNNKIKDILSELKVAPNQLGTAKTIVTAVENWGKTSFKMSQHIYDEYKGQSVEAQTTLSELSLKEGSRLGAFDNILHEVEAKNVTIHPSDASFLMQTDYLVEADKVHHIGIYQNAFRDEINLSDRLWQYPVDNEVCKVEEHDVSFEEHVFLEYMLDDFPSKGPVRRFMELVINGLQQNPHLTVENKKERVSWFKDYFSNFSDEELNF